MRTGARADPPRPRGDPLADARYRARREGADPGARLSGRACHEQQRGARARAARVAGRSPSRRRSSRSATRRRLRQSAPASPPRARRAARSTISWRSSSASSRRRPGRFFMRRARSGAATSPRGFENAASRSRRRSSIAPRRGRNSPTSPRTRSRRAPSTACSSIRSAARRRSRWRFAPATLRRLPRASHALPVGGDGRGAVRRRDGKVLVAERPDQLALFSLVEAEAAARKACGRCELAAAFAP